MCCSNFYVTHDTCHIYPYLFPCTVCSHSCPQQVPTPQLVKRQKLAPPFAEESLTFQRTTTLVFPSSLNAVSVKICKTRSEPVQSEKSPIHWVLGFHFFFWKNIPTTAIHVGTRWGCDSRKLLESLRHGHHLLPTREADSETAIEETAWPFLLLQRPQWAGSNFTQNQHAPKVRKCRKCI